MWSSTIASRRVCGLIAVALTMIGSLAVESQAASTTKKSMWGPVRVAGQSQFPIYRELGVGIFQTALRWNEVAKSRPVDAANPADPAYVWPHEIDDAIREGSTHRVAVSLLVTGAPAWANGGRSEIWAPTQPRHLAQFITAAARRYPRVRRWMIWNEPSKTSRFRPLVTSVGRRISTRQKRGPRLYARMLDASYSALKRVNRRNIVTGGNTWTGGEVSPLNFIKSMRLPNGRRPRMDLYGHNPFTARTPNLSNDPISYGYADFSDLDTLARWLDRYGYRAPRRRRLRLFLSEMVIPTDHRNHEFNFWVDRRTQASWIKAALRITRRSKRIATFGYFGLYDESPRADGLEVNRGLLDWKGNRKPAYYAFKRG